jgi:hypothetical protein
VRVVDTITLVPSRYGETDLWISKDEYDRGPGRWHELRMRCNYILYTGPAGATRIENGGRQVPGPHGSLIPQVGIIAVDPLAKPEYLDVKEGDVLVLNDQNMVICDDRRHGYPRLVTETEWGVVLARRAVNDQMNALLDDPGMADPQAAAQINVLYRIHARLCTSPRDELIAPSTHSDPWAEITAGPRDNGDSAGQAQLSTAWGRRFVAHLDGDYHVALDVEAVVVDANHPEPGGAPKATLTLTVAVTGCTNPADPTGTEITATHVDLHLPGPATDERARALCESFAAVPDNL